MMRTVSGAGSTGDALPQKAGVIGSDDVLVREYHPGDDVRRIAHLGNGLGRHERGDLDLREAGVNEADINFLMNQTTVGDDLRPALLVGLHGEP